MNPSRLAPSLALAALIFGSLTAASASAAAPVHGHASYRAHQSDVAACAGAQETPDASNLASIRAAVMCLINRERTSRGERALTENAHLQASAQGHTDSMVSGDYFEHVGPNGQTPANRDRAAGYMSSSRAGYEIGENIAWGTLSLATPQAIVSAWMESPGHRANILDAQFRDTGIGVSPQAPSSLSGGQAGAIYTQDFGVIVH